MSSPIGGTVSIHHRHGVSDPVPYNADAAVMREAFNEAAERDAAITELHQVRMPELAADCRVCNPPQDGGPYWQTPPWRWHDEVLYRVRMAWRALRYGDD